MRPAMRRVSVNILWAVPDRQANIGVVCFLECRFMPFVDNAQYPTGVPT